jgi:hypothetical protein
MTHLRLNHPLMVTLLCCGLACASPATDDDTDTDGQEWNGGYLLASIVITDVGRTTYFSVVPELDGHLTNDNAIEVPGNAVYLVSGNTVLVGLAEAPTWVKWEISESGELTQVGQLSLANYGLSAIDFGNTIVDETTAVSVSSDSLLAIVWNPSSMTITGTVDLSHLEQDGYDLENWTTTAGPDGLVYIPGRWADWNGARIYPQVSMTIIDPKALAVVAIAEDDRCASGGRAVFGPDGHAYVVGDGRNYSAQMFENAGAEPAADNCILRIAPGASDFDPDYYFAIPSLTGGLEIITELDTAEQGSGVGFLKVFDPEQLPAGIEPVDFDFWNYNAHKLWRLDLGDEPSMKPVEGAPFSAIGFTGVATRGRLYLGESEDAGANSTVYEVDPSTNTMSAAFTMDGYFYGAHALP